jgi:nucleoid-associated protein YgaU
MGKVEKVIVLSVLFVIALILVVSLTVDDPLERNRIVEAGAPLAKGPAADQLASAPAPAANQPAAGAGVAPVLNGSTPLLSTNVVASPATSAAPASAGAAEAAPVNVAPSIPAGALLHSLEGLEDSILPDMKLYTWKDGDSYRLIAHKYYGNWEKFTVLRRSNEGRNDVKPGQKIFVPVFDTDASGAVAYEPVAPEPAGAKKTPGAKNATAPAPATVKDAKDAKPSGKKVHLVKEGESLWKISKQELGDGGRWKEIYELNRDVLAKPESVHKGQRLRIP